MNDGTIYVVLAVAFALATVMAAVFALLVLRGAAKLRDDTTPPGMTRIALSDGGWVQGYDHEDVQRIAEVLEARAAAMVA